MQSKKPSKFHIIHGNLKNRKVLFPNLLSIRPTSNRIRKRIFDWLDPYIKHARCLDLFAGSGALGMEMISRGALHVTFVDHDINAIKDINRAVKELAIEPSKYQCTLDAFQHQQSTRYDVLFIDPPFFELNLSGIIHSLYKADFIQKDTIVYIESSRWNNIHNIQHIKRWRLLKSATTRNIRYSLFCTN